MKTKDTTHGLTDLQRELATIRADRALAVANHEAALRLFDSKEKDLTTQMNYISVGLDRGAIELALTVLDVSDYRRGGDDWQSCRRDAIQWLTTQEPLTRYGGDLRKQYFGTKNYDYWRGQREDHSYGAGPRHGSTCFHIGLRQEARSRTLTPAETDAAIYYLMNLERIQNASRGDA